MAYIVPPYVAAAVSFVCAREALGNISAEKVSKNDTILLTKHELNLRLFKNSPE